MKKGVLSRFFMRTRHAAPVYRAVPVILCPPPAGEIPRPGPRRPRRWHARVTPVVAVAMCITVFCAHGRVDNLLGVRNCMQSIRYFTMWSMKDKIMGQLP